MIGWVYKRYLDRVALSTGVMFVCDYMPALGYRMSGCEHILPNCPLSADVLLKDDGCLSLAQVFLPLAPPADVLLDGHAGTSQPVQAQFLQISYLSSSEEDLGATKLVLVGVLEMNSLRSRLVTQTCRQCTRQKTWQKLT